MHVKNIISVVEVKYKTGRMIKMLKKVACVVMAAVVCVGMMGMQTSADVVDSVTKITDGGGQDGTNKTEASLSAEKTYVTPATAGFFGYEYAAYCKYTYNLNTADEWVISGTFNLRTGNDVISDRHSASNGWYIATTRNQTEEQYISANIIATASSTSFGDVTLNLNVTY